MKKRILSLILTVGMVLGLLPAGLSPARAAQANINPNLPGDVEKLGGVYTTDILNQIWDHVKAPHQATDRSVNASIGAIFGLYSHDPDRVAFTRDVAYREKEGYGLFQNTVITQNSMDAWEAEFRPREFALGRYQDLLATGQVTLCMGAALEDHGKSFPWVRFNGQELFRSSERGELQELEGSVKLSSLSDTDRLTIGGDSCITPIQRSFVKNFWAVLVDNTAPTVKTVDFDSSARLLKIYMNEPVRWADNYNNLSGANDLCTLQVTATNPRSSQEAWTFDAYLDCVSKDDQGYYLGFTVQDQNVEEYELTRIVDGTFKSEEFSLDVRGVTDGYQVYWGESYGTPDWGREYNGDGHLTHLVTSSPVTDMAGNPVALASINRMDLSSHHLRKDVHPPKITGVSVSGSMITSGSSKVTVDEYGQPTDWPAEIDRSSIFAGVGDDLYFTLEGDEELVFASNARLELNVEQLAHIPAGDGTLEHWRGRTVFLNHLEGGRFGPLRVTEDMFIRDSEFSKSKSCIHPIRIHGGVGDRAGNNIPDTADPDRNPLPQDDRDLTKVMPRQTIFLDVAAPEMELLHRADGKITSYDPTTRILTLQIGVNDRAGVELKKNAPVESGHNNLGGEASGFVGQQAKVGLGAPGTWIYHTRYRYLITESEEPPAPGDFPQNNVRFFSGGDKPWEQCSYMEIPMTGNPVYVHVYFDSAVTDIPNGEEIIPGGLELYGYTADWAGNRTLWNDPIRLGTDDPEGGFFLDQKAPTVDCDPLWIHYNENGQGGTVDLSTKRVDGGTFNGYVKVGYDHGKKGGLSLAGVPCAEVEYRWNFQPKDGPNPVLGTWASLGKGVEYPDLQHFQYALPPYPFTANGTVTLEVRATDASGNVTEKSWSAVADVGAPALNYKVEGEMNVPSAQPGVLLWPSAAKDDGTTAYVKVSLHTQAGVGRSGHQDDYGALYQAILWSDNAAVTAEDPVCLFNFDDTRLVWHDANGQALDADALATLKKDYGPVELTIETGYAAKFDGVNTSSVVPNQKNPKAAVISDIRYAPVLPGALTVSEPRVYLTGTQEQLDAGDQVVSGTLEGVRVVFNLADAIMNGEMEAQTDGLTIKHEPNWGTGAMDPANSYLSLVNEQGQEVYRAQLSNCDPRPTWSETDDINKHVPNQEIYLPRQDAQGRELISGRYTIRLHVEQRGDTSHNSALDKTCATKLYLDASNEVRGGLWMKSFFYGDMVNSLITSHGDARVNLVQEEFFYADVDKPAAERQPFDSITISRSPFREEFRSNLYSVETAFGSPNLYLGVADNGFFKRDYDGETGGNRMGGQLVNTAVDIRVWNAEYEQRTHSDGSSQQVRNDYRDIPFRQRPTSYYEYRKDPGSDNEVPQDFTLWSVPLTICSEEEFASSDLLTQGEQLPHVAVLEGAVNTIRYQFKMANGQLSQVFECTVNFTDKGPSGQLSMLPRMDLQGKLEVMDVRLPQSTLFSPNGAVSAQLLYQGSLLFNGSEFSEPNVETHAFASQELGADDLISLTGSAPFFQNMTYTTAGALTAADKMEHCSAVFLITDEAGAAALYIPQVGPDSAYGTIDAGKLSEVSWYNDSDDYLFDPMRPSDFPAPPYVQCFKFDGDWNDFDLSASYFQVWGGDPIHFDRIAQDGPAQGVIVADWTRDRRLVIGAEIDPNLDYNYGCSLGFHMVSKSGAAVDLTASGTLHHAHDTAPTVVWDWNMQKVRLDFQMLCKDTDLPDGRYLIRHGYDWNNGEHTVNMVDAYGGKHSYTVTVDCAPNNRPVVTYDPAGGKSSSQVKIEVQAPEGSKQTYLVTSQEQDGYWRPMGEETLGAQNLLNNNTGHVTVIIPADKAAEGACLWISWKENDEDCGMPIPVTIAPVQPKISWSYTAGEVKTGDIVYGNVTATVTDANWELVDAATGEVAQHTFYIGEAKGASHAFTVKDEEGKTHQITATLAVTPTQPPADESDPNAELKKTLKPSVMLRAYTASEPGSALTDRQLHTLYEELNSLNPALTVPAGSTDKVDSQTLVDALGWAVRYRFQVVTGDVGSVKLLLKRAGTETVTFADQSDTIDGVSLNGAALDISKNAEFVLFAVNDRNNFVRMPMKVTEQSNLPPPTVVKTLLPDGTVKVTLTSKVLKNLKLLDTQNQQVDSLIYNTNGTYKPSFTCTFGNTQVTDGKVTVVIDEIDDRPLALVNNQYGQPISWSANHTKEKTNQDVLATFRFTKPIQAVAASAADGQSAALEQELEDAGVQILISGNQVTVRYGSNYPKQLVLMCYTDKTDVDKHQLSQLRTKSVTLEAVSNIDKNAPVISHADPVLAQDGRSASVSFTADETVILAEAGKRYEPGTEITYTAETNGTYDFHFSDLAGNATGKVTVEIAGIVRTNPVLTFRLNSSSSELDSALALGKLDAGANFQVKADRSCQIALNNLPVGDYTPNYTLNGDWVTLTLTESDLGMTPSVVAVDQYGNLTRSEMVELPLPDKTPPVIRLTASALVLTEGVEDLVNKLKANAAATDRTPEGDIPCAVTVLDPDGTEFTVPATAGTYEVLYRAADAKGNTANRIGLLRLTSGDLPTVCLEGRVLTTDNVATFSAPLDGGLSLSVDLHRTEPFRVSWKKGMKTVGQMKKVGVTYLRDGAGNSLLRCGKGQPVDLELPFGESGFYTICITTQGRQYFCFQVYVN